MGSEILCILKGEYAKREYTISGDVSGVEYCSQLLVALLCAEFADGVIRVPTVN